MSYAFIGLGNLGARLATRLAARHRLAVYDADPARRESVEGARACTDPRDAVAGAAAVFTCLPGPDVSRALMTAADGVLQAMDRGSCWVELSTVGPEDVAAFVDAAAQHGVTLMECPVTGGVTRASSGEMTMFVGADAAVLEEAHSRFGGGAWTAHVVKKMADELGIDLASSPGEEVARATEETRK